MSAISLSLGLATCASGSVEPTGPTVALALTPLADGTIEATVDESTLTVTVVEPEEFAGTYTVDSAELESGPVALLPPLISGTGDIGTTISRSRPGLWLFTGTAPLVAMQWMRATFEVPGAVASEYLVSGADAAATLSLRETVTDANGARSSASNGIAIPVVSEFAVGFVANGSTDYSVATTALTVPGLGFGAEHPRRDLFVAVGILYGPATSDANITGVSIGGVPATPVVASDPRNGPVEIWRARVPSGQTGSISATTNFACVTIGAAVYRAIDARVAATATGSVAGETVVGLPVATTAGSVVVAAGKSANSGALSLSGVTALHAGDMRTSDFFASGLSVETVAQTPRAVAVTAAAAGNIGGVALVLEAE